MRAVVIAPGHIHSTYDVHTGLCAGLRANGVEVSEFPLHKSLELFELLVGAAQTIKISDTYPDPLLLASGGIPGFVMAKRPEWVIFVHGLNIPPSIPETLRRGGYKTALLCTESPYQIDHERNVAPLYDVILTSEKRAISLFTENQPGTIHYLPHAFNPNVHTPEGDRAVDCDVFFCGTLYPERAVLLDGVDWTDINVCDKTVKYIDGEAPADFGAQVVENHVVATYYRSAKISLNHHRRIQHPTTGGEIGVDAAVSLNPRAFEVPACGGFLVSDQREELAALFGDCVPTYTDSASLEHIIRYYLTHEDERAELARMQHARVLAHSWTARAAQLLDVLTAHSRPQRAAA